MKKIIRMIVKYFKETDKLLILLCLVASALSIIFLTGLVNSSLTKASRISTQIAATLIGLVCALIMSKIDYHFMAKLWKLHMPVAIFFMLLTFLFGIRVSDFVDDRAWLEIPFIHIQFQPSELLKMSFVLSFALHLSKVQGNLNDIRNVILLCLHALVPLFLVLRQGDDGTAIIFVMIFLSMIFTAGINWKYILAGISVIAVAVPIAWYNFLDDDKRLRFMVLFDPELDKQGVAMQQNSAKLSIGSGQMFGKGVFKGEHHFVPEVYTDFIFSFIGEAMGFMGCMLVVTLLASICIKILINTNKTVDLLGKYILVGVFAIISSQSVTNIGMNIGVLPVIGLTLPFFSAGGTSVVSLYLGLGLSLSVYMHSKSSLFLDK